MLKFDSIKKINNKNVSQFETILFINNKKISIGFGNSKKTAEKDASRIACEKLEL